MFLWTLLRMDLGIYASKTQTFPSIFLFPKFQRTTSGFSPEKCVPFLEKNQKKGDQTSFYFAAVGGEILFTQPLTKPADFRNNIRIASRKFNLLKGHKT